MVYKRPVSILVVPYTAESVLLLRRTDPADYWQSITGSLEWGETPSAAARRELKEETGINADAEMIDTGIINHFPILAPWNARYDPKVSQNEEHLFVLPLRTEMAIVLNETEHLAYQWVNFQEALSLVSSSTNRNAIKLILETQG